MNEYLMNAKKGSQLSIRPWVSGGKHPSEGWKGSVPWDWVKITNNGGGVQLTQEGIFVF